MTKHTLYRHRSPLHRQRPFPSRSSSHTYSMRKYTAFFRLQFSMGLQYRAAAFAGIVTQFVWGCLEIFMFRAFYEADASSFPMTFAAASAYVWMQQAFLALFMPWMMDNEIFSNIRDGNVSYELCRPVGLYQMWFVKNLASRLARAVLRCMPILIIAALLPYPYGLMAPAGISSFLLFLFTLLTGLAVTVAICMLIYISAFFTLSPDGIRMTALCVIEFLSGAIIPLPFLPETMQRLVSLLPFASMQNIPLRIYSGDLSGSSMQHAVCLQLIWLILLIIIGRQLTAHALRRVTLQGG